MQLRSDESNCKCGGQLQLNEPSVLTLMNYKILNKS